VAETRPTPARAGTTRPRRLPAARQHPHPRSRGDHQRRPLVGRNLPGPPPLARGPPVQQSEIRLRAGPTPARAGTTPRRFGRSSTSASHPRSRGDHTIRAQSLGQSPGPPPLARGPRCRDHYREERGGPTPARAGTTSSPSSSAKRIGAHPRSRGDHVNRELESSRRAGPPPLARGPRVLPERNHHVGRPTPARAGTTIAMLS